jgi:hypothetical protein
MFRKRVDTPSQFSALREQCCQGNLTAIRQACNAGVLSFSPPNSDLQLLFDQIVETNQVEIFEFLLKYAQQNSTSLEKVYRFLVSNVTVYQAVYYKRFDLLKRMFEAAAAVDFETIQLGANRAYILRQAIQSSSLEIVRYLFEDCQALLQPKPNFSVDCDFDDDDFDDDERCLSRSAMRRQFDVLEYLLVEVSVFLKPVFNFRRLSTEALQVISTDAPELAAKIDFVCKNWELFEIVGFSALETLRQQRTASDLLKSTAYRL